MGVSRSCKGRLMLPKASCEHREVLVLSGNPAPLQSPAAHTPSDCGCGRLSSSHQPQDGEKIGVNIGCGCGGRNPRDVSRGSALGESLSTSVSRRKKPIPWVPIGGAVIRAESGREKGLGDCFQIHLDVVWRCRETADCWRPDCGSRSDPRSATTTPGDEMRRKLLHLAGVGFAARQSKA